ncbi:sporulation protein YqfD [Sporosarcina gallistercoris]|uniref:sporulation protein YqfD n=1 Tax=Sporosarcina gallistercoris TaxID=2762245 RepID=UPI003D2C60AE
MKRKLYDVELSGDGKPAHLVNELIRNKRRVSKLEHTEGAIWFQTDARGLRYIRSNRRRFKLKVHVLRLGDGTPVNRLFHSWVALLLCIVPFLASLFLWQVNVDAEHPEIAERIEQKLEKSAVVPMKLLHQLPDEGTIRSLIMTDEPDLSWVRFEKKGATLTVIPMISPKTSSKSEIAREPGDLVARTGGVITGFQLKSGERVARLNQTVKKGDLLATGVLEQGDKVAIVGAEGSVFADYWLEYKFSLPKTIQYRAAGEKRVIIEWNIPGLKQKAVNRPFWKFVEWNEEVDDTLKTITLEEGMEKDFLVPLLKHKLLSETSYEKDIKDENILQVTFDNDKVTGTILFLINENIAVKRPLSQGGDD